MRKFVQNVPPTGRVLARVNLASGQLDLIGTNGVCRFHVLLERLGGLQPHPLPAGPALSGQPATIRIPHDTGLDPRETPITQARRV